MIFYIIYLIIFFILKSIILYIYFYYYLNNDFFNINPIFSFEKTRKYGFLASYSPVNNNGNSFYMFFFHYLNIMGGYQAESQFLSPLDLCMQSSWLKTNVALRTLMATGLHIIRVRHFQNPFCGSLH